MPANERSHKGDGKIVRTTDKTEVCPNAELKLAGITGLRHTLLVRATSGAIDAEVDAIGLDYRFRPLNSPSSAARVSV